MNTNATLCRRAAGKNGSTLVMVMIATFFVSVIGLTQLAVVRQGNAETERLKNQTQSFTFAEMGMMEFKAMIIKEGNRKDLAYMGLVKGNTPLFTSDVLDDKGVKIGSYKVFVHNISAGSPSNANYKVESYGLAVRDKEACIITTYVYLSATAGNMTGSNSEGGVLFITGDVIWGSVRSNSRFYVSGTPVIKGLASTADTVNQINGKTTSVVNTNIFNSGCDFGVPKIDFNPDLITSLSTNAAVVVNTNCDITFLSSARYSLRYTNTVVTNQSGWNYQTKVGSSWVSNYIVSPKPVSNSTTRNIIATTRYYTNFVQVVTTNTIDSLIKGGKSVTNKDDNIIYVTGVATVSGEVGGEVAIASSDTIQISSNLVYSSKKTSPNPLTWGGVDPIAAEKLGLYAVKKVMITGTQTNTDRNIHASIFVAEGNDSNPIRGFCAQAYQTNFNNPKINLFGSIVQHTRGAVGQSGGKGYLKNYHQDLRFVKNPPPGSTYNNSELFGWSITRGAMK